MKKNILILGFTVFLVSGTFVACKKENVKIERTNQEIPSNIIVEDYRTELKKDFPTQADRERELRRLRAKFEILLSDRDACTQAAWDYGTTEAASHCDDYGGCDSDYQHLIEYVYTNEYYEAHCAME